MGVWGIDLGNTHTRVARWDEEVGGPRLVELPPICRQPGGEEPLEAPRLVPSATLLLEPRGWADRIGRWPFVRKRWFIGREALIGRQALEVDAATPQPNFVSSFKPYLDREPLRTLARIGRRRYSARRVAASFLRELLAEIHRTTGERARDLVLTTPVDAYETYRAELLRITQMLGVRRARFVDEPVAAGLGYGLSLARGRVVLVVDFGGGTFHLAAVVLSAREATQGLARVLAKEGRRMGGNLVDRWVLAEACRRLGLPEDQDTSREDQEAWFWYRLMLGEARRVKEGLFFSSSARFLMAPPPHRLRGAARPGFEAIERVEFTREELTGLLRARGLYRMIEESLEAVLARAEMSGVGDRSVEEVLMIGGSTLLPGVYHAFEKRFGRDRVRAWQPFEAVAYGACAFAAERTQPSDFIVHDYAFMTYDRRTQEPQYTIIVPSGTRFPTRPDLWKGQLVPTCSLGEPETFFKLVVCEIGRPREGEQRFVWDDQGRLHRVASTNPGGSEKVVVPLNEPNPTLGYLDPPHSPKDSRPRLEISFGVNADRWLCATVYDLKRRTHLMKDASVVRLL